MKKYIVIGIVLVALLSFGFAGSSNILQKLINNGGTYDITVSDGGILNTLNSCTIVDQDGVFVKFDYPYNGKTYVYLFDNIVQIRYNTQ